MALDPTVLRPENLPVVPEQPDVPLAGHHSEKIREIALPFVPIGREAARLFGRTVRIDVPTRRVFRLKKGKPFQVRPLLPPNARPIVRLGHPVGRLFEKVLEIVPLSVPISRVAVLLLGRTDRTVVPPSRMRQFQLKKVKLLPLHRRLLPNVPLIVRFVLRAVQSSVPTGRVAARPIDLTVPVNDPEEGPTGQSLPDRMPFLFRLPASKRPRHSIASKKAPKWPMC